MDSLTKTPSWNLKILLFPSILVGLLFFTWEWTLTRPFWDWVDHVTFNWLNSWVQRRFFLQIFWAFNNSSSMDWFHDGVMFFFFFIPLCKAASEEKRQKTAEIIFCVLFLIGAIIFINGTLFPEFLHIQRKSPTAADPTALRLSHIINWIPFKDLSVKSFPGDHGTSGIIFACLVFHFLKIKARLLVIPYTIFFCLPRLVVGAHWFTDIFLGSLPIAVITTSLAFGSPFASLCLCGIKKGLDHFFPRKTRPTPL